MRASDAVGPEDVIGNGPPDFEVDAGLDAVVMVRRTVPREEDPLLCLRGDFLDLERLKGREC